jgi:SpoVK/Ycf46/Vps4 family AAA+-type ATPase
MAMMEASQTMMMMPAKTIQPPAWFRRETFLQHLSGELGSIDYSSTEDLQAEVLRNHNQDTIQELSLSFSMLLSQPVQIGTTADAFQLQQEHKSRVSGMTNAIRSYCVASDIPLKKNTVEQSNKVELATTASLRPSSLQWEPSLLIHSPSHADGKTLLAQAIAKRVGCALVHTIRPATLLAMYGSHADAALESLLHAILVSAAISEKSSSSSGGVCIILDHLDTMLPPRLSGRSSAGDAATPILTAIGKTTKNDLQLGCRIESLVESHVFIHCCTSFSYTTNKMEASYLRNITGSLQRRHQYPFPIKNPLYNLSGAGGRVLTLRLCLVGIVTCPDDGWRSSRRDGGGGGGAGTRSTILDAMVGGRYRIQSLTAKTRLDALKGAFERRQIVLEESARKKLPVLAASAAWAKGSAFQRIAVQLGDMIVVNRNGSTSEAHHAATAHHLEIAMACVKNDSADFAKVSFQASPEEEPQPADETTDHSTSSTYFESVGGITDAKLSLEDALALDPKKRIMLSRFGLSPPTGILLYGPPGCGKTLLAKAVAKLLKAPSSTSAGGSDDDISSLGGTFISLSSSDIVRAEIGTSEKILVSSFEFADKNAPSVIFLDEFQALFTERSRGGSGKLATTLLQCLDDIKRWRELDNSVQPTTGEKEESATGNRVIVLGATNSPWMVDNAFLRTGRFDRVVHVGLPTAPERAAILRVHIGRMRVRGGKGPSFLQELCEQIAGDTSGFSGADLAALCRASAIRALLDVGEHGEIEEKHFTAALDQDVKASSDDDLVRRLQKWSP